MKNQISKLYSAVSAPVAASRDVLTERLQSVRERGKQMNPRALRYNRAVQRDSWVLEYVSNQYKTQKICNEAIGEHPGALGYVPDRFKTQEMCEFAVGEDHYALEHVPYRFVTQEMCEFAVGEDPYVVG